MFIYRIKNVINNKVYIGQTTQPTIRWKDHRNKLNRNAHHNIHLQRAWNEYGEGAFVFEIIETHSTLESLYEAETINIIHYRSMNIEFGYNMSWGGEGTPRSNDTKEKISKTRITRKYSKEKNPFFGKTHSDETKALLSKQSKVRMTPEHLQKMLEARRKNGYAHSESHNIAIGNALRGKPKSEMAKENMKLAWQKRKQRAKNG